MEASKLLDLVQKRLHSLKIPFISVGVSDRAGKKLRITFMNPNGKVRTVDFGAAGSKTFLEHKDEAKKRAYYARHSKIYLKDGSRAIDKKYSPAWWSYMLLWS